VVSGAQAKMREAAFRREAEEHFVDHGREWPPPDVGLGSSGEHRREPGRPQGAPCLGRQQIERDVLLKGRRRFLQQRQLWPADARARQPFSEMLPASFAATMARRSGGASPRTPSAVRRRAAPSSSTS